MNSWQSLRYLDWSRFLRVFLFADVSTVVIPLWALALRLTGTPEDSPELENLRELAADARHELQELLDDASKRADQNAVGSERR